MSYQYISYYCGLIYRIDIIFRKIHGDFLKYYTLLNNLRDIFVFLLNTVNIVTFFVWGQHCNIVIFIVTCECNLLIIQRLRLRVCHRCYCLLVYDDTDISLCLILNRPMVQCRNGGWINDVMVK